MFIFFIIFLIQCAIAIAVIFVLKRLLDKELMKAAFEKFESCKTSPDLAEITVLTASKVNEEFKLRLESVRKRKFPQATFNFQESAQIKGGVVIAMGEDFLDFSLSSRLKDLWS